MTLVQYGYQPTVATEKVYYKDTGTGQLQPGYVLCMDIAEDLTPQAGEFNELQRGRVYVKPATALLGMPKAIVIATPQNLNQDPTDFSGEVEVVIPSLSRQFNVLAEGTTDITAGAALKAVDGQWYLVLDAAPATATTVCYAMEAFTTDATGIIKAFMAR